MSKHRRRHPGPVLLGFLAILVAAVAFVRLAEPFGDRGLANVLTFAIVLVGAVTLWCWFVLASGWSPLVRRRTALATLALGVVLVLSLRIEGYSGSMVPRLGLRFLEPADRQLPGATDLETTASATADLATTTPDDFSQFLGPDRRLAVDGVTLATDWQTRSPELLWRQEIGAGWSAFAVVNGYAVTLEQRGAEQVVTCYEVESGDLVWAWAVPGRFEHPLGGLGPRSTPTIADGRVFALAATGQLVALDGATGGLLWQRNLLDESGMSQEQEALLLPYGRSASPLVVDGMVVVPLGGPPGDPRQAGLLALDAASGDEIWRSPPRQASASSPALAFLAGVEQILIVNEDTVTGHDPSSGGILWEHPWPGVSSADANVSQAVPVPPDRVFVSKGYGQGASLLRLVPAAATGAGGRPGEAATVPVIDVVEVWSSSRVLRTKLTNVTVLDGHVYGLSDGILECVALASGERVWKHGRYHHGQILRVGRHLLVLTEEGEIFLVEATPERPDHVLGRFQAIEGPTWNNLALYGDVLLVRNGQEAAAWRLPLENRGGDR